MNLAEYCEGRKFQNCLSGVHGDQTNLKFSDTPYSKMAANKLFFCLHVS